MQKPPRQENAVASFGAVDMKVAMMMMIDD